MDFKNFLNKSFFVGLGLAAMTKDKIEELAKKMAE
jgi:polyhydroxyalkanoate synthesis regulator phasin